MNFMEFVTFINLLKNRIPENANVVIDFDNHRWINEDLKQCVVNFNYDKITNDFKIVFIESKDKKKDLLFSRTYNLNNVRRK